MSVSLIWLVNFLSAENVRILLSAQNVIETLNICWISSWILYEYLIHWELELGEDWEVEGPGPCEPGKRVVIRMGKE